MSREATSSKHFLFDKNSITINGLRITDNEIVSHFRQYEGSPELEERFQNTLKAGVVAVRTAVTVDHVHFVQKEFNGLSTEIKETFKTMFGENGEFSELLESHFGKDGKIVNELFDPDTKGTPLHKVLTQLDSRLKDISDKVTTKDVTKQIEEKTTIKGMRFEDSCQQCLAGILRIHGDSLERTGTKPGEITNSKKGDFVVTLGNGDGKIVVEAKDEKKLSIDKIRRELDEAIENRGASYGIFIVRNVKALDDHVGYFHELGNKLICAVGNGKDDQTLYEEILLIAYKWAKFKVSLETVKKKKLDVSFVAESIKSIQSDLKDFTKIITKCGNIEDSVEIIRGTANGMRKKIDGELELILESLENVQDSETMSVKVKK